MTPWLTDTLLRAQTDDRLVALARDGHERAFVAIVERYRRPLHAYASRLVSDGRAEDVLQQAFANAWAALRGGADVGHLRGWLHEIVRNAAWRTTASGRVTAELPDELAASGSTAEDVERSLLLQRTFAELAELPERQRAAFVETAVHGRSRQEVAGALGLSEGAVRQLVHRARTSLRAAVTALTPLPLLTTMSGKAAQPGSLVTRIGELVAGAGASAGAAGAFIKTGTVVLAVGTAATGAVTLSEHRHHAPAPKAKAGAAPMTALPGPPGASLQVRRVAATRGAGAGKSDTRRSNGANTEHHTGREGDSGQSHFDQATGGADRHQEDSTRRTDDSGHGRHGTDSRDGQQSTSGSGRRGSDDGAVQADDTQSSSASSSHKESSGPGSGTPSDDTPVGSPDSSGPGSGRSGGDDGTPPEIPTALEAAPPPDPPDAAEPSDG